LWKINCFWDNTGDDIVFCGQVSMFQKLEPQVSYFSNLIRIHVRYVVGKVTLGQIPLQVWAFFCQSSCYRPTHLLLPSRWGLSLTSKHIIKSLVFCQDFSCDSALRWTEIEEKFHSFIPEVCIIVV